MQVLWDEAPPTKANGRDNVGVCRAHSFSWLLSSPQQPLETEDSPTVSLAPQYTSQRLCRATDKSRGICPREFILDFKLFQIKRPEMTADNLSPKVPFTLPIE